LFGAQARRKPAVDAKRQLRMSDLFASDATHGVAYGRLRSVGALAQRHERAPRLANATFYGVLQRQLFEGANRARVALDGWDTDAKTPRHSSHRARVPALVARAA
jgi:hypothetical protein